METRIENQQRFNLLSSDLAEISRALNSRWAEEQPLFRAWVGPMDLSMFETDFFDERVAADVAEYLMRRLNMFGHLPKLAIKLETHFRDAKAGGDDYWQFALKSQQNRLKGTIKGISELTELEKKLKNVRRGIERASETLAIESDPITHLASFARKIMTRVRTPDESAHGVVSKLVADVQVKVAKAYEKVLNLEDEEKDLADKIALRQFVDQIMAETREALLSVGKKNKVVAKKIPISPSEDIIAENLSKKRKTTQPVAEKDAAKKEEEKDKFDNLEITKAKLTQLIEAARTSGNKLKILVPPEGRLRIRFEQQWNGVLSKMGFDGSVEFVVYEDLKRTTDTQTPLIVFKGMNTHGNLWNRAKFENVSVIDMAPLLIINSL